MSGVRPGLRSAPRAVPSACLARSPAEPEPDHVLEHVDRAADRAHLGRCRVAPYHRNLGYLYALIPCSIQDLGRIGTAIGGQPGNDPMRDDVPKQLEALLRIP